MVDEGVHFVIFLFPLAVFEFIALDAWEQNDHFAYVAYITWFISKSEWSELASQVFHVEAWIDIAVAIVI